MDTNMFQILARHSDPDSQAAAELVRSVSASYHSEWEAAQFMITHDQLLLAEAYLLSRAEALLHEVGNQLRTLVGLCKRLEQKEILSEVMHPISGAVTINHLSVAKISDNAITGNVEVKQVEITNNEAPINIGEQKIIENEIPNTEHYVIHSEQPWRDQDRQADEHHDAAALGYRTGC